VPVLCPNGHEVVQGGLFCPYCGHAYVRPDVSKAAEMVTLAAKVGGGASGLPASPVQKPTGGVDIPDPMASESGYITCPKCRVAFSRGLFESHRGTCRHRLVTCPKCNNLFGSETLERHLQDCPGSVVYGTVSLQDNHPYAPPSDWRAIAEARHRRAVHWGWAIGIIVLVILAIVALNNLMAAPKVDGVGVLHTVHTALGLGVLNG
jgi:uncharacterized protein YbaR (Trm112 family)